MSETPLLPKPLLRLRLPILLAIAFGIGLLLFLLVWLNSRRSYDFYKADGSEAKPGQVDGLPVPLPPDLAAPQGPSGLALDPADAPPAQTPAQTSPPRITDTPKTPAERASPPPPTAAPMADGNRDTPEPLTATPPRYPQDAMRRGIGGTVRVRVHVAADGSVSQVGLAEGSGHRGLDRAAMDAVEKWRFKPATHAGQPVPAEVVVPIVFSPGR